MAEFHAVEIGELIAGSGGRAGSASIIVAHDFSENAWAALRAAVRLGNSIGAEITLVYVTQPLLSKRSARRRLEETIRELDPPPSRARIEVAEGTDPSQSLCDIATKLGSDLIVIGARGRDRLELPSDESVAERTALSAPCPILTVHAANEGANWRTTWRRYIRPALGTQSFDGTRFALTFPNQDLRRFYGDIEESR